MIEQSCLLTFESGHVASIGVSSHFGVASYHVLGRQTLLFINVVSFHLTPVGDLKREKIFLYSSFILHPYLFLLLLKENPHHQPKWPTSHLQVLTLPRIV